MKERQNAVVVLYSPKELAEFAWFYCKYGKQYNWTAVCAPYGNIAEYMFQLCENSGLFVEILADNRNFQNMSLKNKMALFGKMTLSFFAGKRRKLCKKIVRECIGERNPDLVVIPCDYGVLPGAFLACSDEWETVIMEDGGADYVERYKWIQVRRVKSIYEIIGFLLAKMGYANPGLVYVMNDTVNCVKFSTEPAKMRYRNYKKICKMDNISNFSSDEYDDIIYRAYGMSCERYSGDILLLTSPLTSYVCDESMYVKKLEEYINLNYSGKTILLKRHPRDDKEYKFSDSIKVIELDKNIPMEILLKRINVNKAFSVYTSTAVLSLKEYIDDIYIFYFKCIEESMNGQLQCDYKKNFKEGIRILEIDREKICVVE